MLVRHIFSVFLALFALPMCAAGAESPAAVFSRYDLLGTWAFDCNLPPSQVNWFITNSATADGGVKTQYDGGMGGSPLLSVTDSAHVLTDTTLHMKVRYDDARWGASNGLIFMIVTEVTAGRSHTVQSTRSDGTIEIKESKVVANGQPSLFIYKCSGGRPNA